MSSRYSVEADNKLTAYCAMIVHFGRSAHLIALYSPAECENDCWLNIYGKISERLDEVFGGKGSFDKYVEEHTEDIKKAYETIKQLC